MAFFFIRHLPTAFNRDGLLQGQRNENILPPDADLLKSIAHNKMKLANHEPFAAILCSPLARTAQTAQHYDYQARIEPLLKEIDFGRYEAQPKQQLLQTQTEQWQSDPLNLQLGEPVSALVERIESFFRQYQDKGNILVFGHGFWIRAARAYLQHGDLRLMNHSDLDNNALIVLHTP